MFVYISIVYNNLLFVLLSPGESVQWRGEWVFKSSSQRDSGRGQPKKVISLQVRSCSKEPSKEPESSGYLKEYCQVVDTYLL